jgi:hypothetical protein
VSVTVGEGDRLVTAGEGSAVLEGEFFVLDRALCVDHVPESRNEGRWIGEPFAHGRRQALTVGTDEFVRRVLELE